MCLKWVWVAPLLLLVGAGCKSSDAGGGGDGDADGDLDGDVDGDADGLPECAVSDYVSLPTHGVSEDFIEATLDGAHELVVVSSGRDVVLESDLDCNPYNGAGLTLESHGSWSAEACLPGEGAVLTASFELGPEDVGAWAELRSPDGILVWEGGSLHEGWETERRFRIVDVASASECALADSPDCMAETRLSAAVQTDDGEVELASGESRVVTVEGEPFVAVVTHVAWRRLLVEGCVTHAGTGRGPAFGNFYLARTTPADLPQVDLLNPSTDSCPAHIPAELEPCDVEGLRCSYPWGGGCEWAYLCDRCVWRLESRSEPEGVDCGISRTGCVDDGECADGQACTDCPCPEPIGERRRCVWPDEFCPPCEE